MIPYYESIIKNKRLAVLVVLICLLLLVSLYYFSQTLFQSNGIFPYNNSTNPYTKYIVQIQHKYSEEQIRGILQRYLKTRGLSEVKILEAQHIPNSSFTFKVQAKDRNDHIYIIYIHVDDLLGKIFKIGPFIVKVNNTRFDKYDYFCPLIDQVNLSIDNAKKVIYNVLSRLNYTDLLSDLDFYILDIDKVNYTYSISFTVAINGTPVWLVYDRIFVNPCLNLTEVSLSPRIYYLIKTKHYVTQKIGLDHVKEIVLDRYRELYEDKYGSINRYMIKIMPFTLTSNISSKIVYTSVDLDNDGFPDLLVPICSVDFTALTSKNIELECAVTVDLYSGDCKFNCSERGG